MPTLRVPSIVVIQMMLISQQLLWNAFCIAVLAGLCLCI